MSTWARYYPRNTVIPCVIPKKLICANSMQLFFGWYKYSISHTQTKERIQRYFWSKGRTSAHSGKGPKFGSRCDFFSSGFFCSFFFLLTLLSVVPFPDHHFLESCVSHTCSPCTKLRTCLDHVPPPPPMPSHVPTHENIPCSLPLS